MNKKTLFFVIAGMLSLTGVKAQLAVDSLSRSYVGYPALPEGNTRTLNIACPDTVSGLSVGDAFNLYTRDDAFFSGAYLTPGFGKYGLRMDNRGKIRIITNENSSYNLDSEPFYNVEYPNNTPENRYKEAALTIHAAGSRCIHTISHGAPYGGSIRSDVMGPAIGLSVFNVSPHSMPEGREMVFYVNGNGDIYSYGGLTQTSDRTAKEDISPVDLSSLAKIDSLQAVTFRYKNGGGKERSALSAVKGRTDEITSQMQAEQSRKRIGLIAQDVEKVVPEVVRTLEDGTKGIMYSDLIPLLIEAIKEQQQQITDLKDKVAALEDEGKGDNGNNNKLKSYPAQDGTIGSSLQGDAELYQNRPNPFDGTTEIRYKVPQNAASAFIGIYNLSGSQVKRLTIAPGDGTVILSASELPSGIYIYSLIIEGKEIANKRMVVQ